MSACKKHEQSAFYNIVSFNNAIPPPAGHDIEENYISPKGFGTNAVFAYGRIRKTIFSSSVWKY